VNVWRRLIGSQVTMLCRQTLSAAVRPHMMSARSRDISATRLTTKHTGIRSDT